jgi:hypothetical protein
MTGLFEFVKVGLDLVLCGSGLRLRPGGVKASWRLRRKYPYSSTRAVVGP